MENNKTIYNLKLHETFSPYKGLDIMRVAGGWLYTMSEYRRVSMAGDEKRDHISNVVFVPFNNEFQPR